jgi:hypothetical protein
VLSNVVLTTTHWDIVDQTLALEREAELRNMYWKGMMEREAKDKRYDGSRDAAWKVVDSLLSVDRNVLNIQTDSTGRSVPDTDVGRLSMKSY